MVQHRVRRLPVVDGERAGRDRHPRRHRGADRQPRGGAEDDRRGHRGSAAPVLLPRAGLSGSGAQQDELLAWEERWALRSALADAASAIALIVAGRSSPSAASAASGDAELLRNVDAHSSAVSCSPASCRRSASPAGGARSSTSSAPPQARSETVRGQLVGVVVAAPLFLAVSAGSASAHATKRPTSSSPAKRRRP